MQISQEIPTVVCNTATIQLMQINHNITARGLKHKTRKFSLMFLYNKLLVELFKAAD